MIAWELLTDNIVDSNPVSTTQSNVAGASNNSKGVVSIEASVVGSSVVTL